MSKVKNRKALRRLAVRKLLSERSKNIIAVFAIMLTAVLFTSLFTIGNYLLQSTQETTMRQVGGSAHAGIKYCLPEDVEKLSKDSAVKEWGTRLFIGSADNEELLKTPSEIGCVDENYAKYSFCEPTTGTLPTDYRDCAVSTLVLDALGLPHELGVTIPLTFQVNGTIVTEEFSVCGFFEGDIVSRAQMIFISRAWCEENIPKRTQACDGYDISGYIQFDFFFHNSYNIEKKVKELLIRNGYNPDETMYGVNWAYAGSMVDTTTLLLIAVLLLLIIVSGYLIIYNMFYIRVSSDIRNYGLLKTIGTTGKQLKRVVRLQALYLSAAGIPVGLLAGYFLGMKLVPVIVEAFTINEGMHTHITLNPWVFLGAGMFSLITVWLSCIRPCRLAAKVSPIEAVRYVENSGMKIKAKSKRSRKVTAFSMALGNVKRTPKKVILVVLSISLSLILLNIAYSVIKGFDMDKFVQEGIAGDFIIKDATVGNVYASVINIQGIDKTIIQDIETSGIGFDHEEIYHTQFLHKLNDTVYQREQDYIHNNANAWIFSQDYVQYDLEEFERTHEIWLYAYGIGKWTAENLVPVEGEIDAEKFMTGEYCIVGPYGMSLNDEKSYCAGDKICVEFPDGAVKEYEVMAVAKMRYPLSVQSYSILGFEVILPQQEYLEHFKPEGAMMSVLNLADHSDTDRMEEWISTYTTGERKDLTYVSRKTYEMEFEQLKLMIAVVGGVLSFILALIGILNFINSVVTGILSRKREFSMMEAVGMTGKQLKSMLVWEGIVYAALTAIFVSTIGMVICRFVVMAFAGQMWFFTWHFEILPIVLCVPVLIAVSWIVPVIAYRKMLKESVVERLRGQE